MEARELSHKNNLKNEEIAFQDRLFRDEVLFNNCKESISKQIKNGNNSASCSSLSEKYKKFLIDNGYKVEDQGYSKGLDWPNGSTKVIWEKK